MRFIEVKRSGDGRTVLLNVDHIVSVGIVESMVAGKDPLPETWVSLVNDGLWIDGTAEELMDRLRSLG